MRNKVIATINHLYSVLWIVVTRSNKYEYRERSLIHRLLMNLYQYDREPAYELTPVHVVMVELVQEIKPTKREYERQQALLDMEHCDLMREQYMRLYDTLEAEWDATYTTDRRRTQLQRQIIVLEERLYNIGKRKNKAYFTAYAV